MTLDAKGPEASPPGATQHWEGEAKRHQEVHDRSPDGLMIFRAVRDSAGTIVDFEWLYSNPSASKIVGRRSEDLLGKRLLVEMPGNKQEGLFDIYVRVVELGEAHSHEFPYRHEGLDNWFRATSIKQGDGFYVAFTDLTARKRAEVQASRLAAIVRSSEHAYYITSATGIVETWNDGAEKLYGYTSVEMVGQSIWGTIPERCWPEHEEALRRVLAGGTVASFRTECLTKGGIVVQISITLSPISDLDHKVVGTATIAQDVSEQVKLQKRLTELKGMALEAQAGAEQIRKILRGLVTFPLACEERLAMELRRVLDPSVSTAPQEIDPRDLPSKTRTDAAPAGYILVIHADAMARSTLQRALGQQHFLTCPKTSADALALIEAGMRFDLILCHVAIPGLSAPALHVELVHHHPEQARRFAFLTAGLTSPEVIELMAAASTPRLVNSIGPLQLRAVVGDLLLELGLLDRTE